MIPLTLKAEFEPTQNEPFVVRLGDDSVLGGATIAGELDGSIYFQYQGRTFSVECATDQSLVGDVVFANPVNETVNRWLRSGAKHNTLLVTERCDQLCQMCSQPPRKTHVDMFPYLEEACLLADLGAQIGFSGGEPLLYKQQLFELVERVSSKRPDLSFHILSNAQHFTPDDIGRLAHPAFERVLWGIPLYSSHPALHDDIVVKEGAFDRLLQSLSILARAGQAIELRTVIMQSNYQKLPDLALMISDRVPFVSHWAIMQLERIGFARNRWDALFIDHSANPGPLEAAVAQACARGVDTALFNMPYCTVGPELKAFLHNSISDWKQAWPSDCTDCTAKSLCGGFFAWHPSVKDYARGGAIR
ncbi:MAG: His-Xaa-Ser system radical SAM maturase HxsC [Henriciella sp.]|jgi:His-Xaa-Ser system radical SAM maturase HxsC|nr:His-Xaa-Ser system radical SAM maturase HxsC [Henriciella sp.]MAO81281.1 His-Xaa-Ser system radical SAM maturase HxsC [Nocardioides sp.]MBK74353.1 His-Xaa-Ser system radical SAM maturase HxsC [Henriciella sp.]|tara:strand:+ start:9379 stop:10461 length:1083 start_codon:yes stop_codon:yes gene_type:complete